MSQLGTRIKTLRENKNITLIEAGKAIGCDSGLLSKMERGQRAIPKNLLEKLAKYYKVEIEELPLKEAILTLKRENLIKIVQDGRIERV